MSSKCVFSSLAQRLEAFRNTDVYPVITTEFCAGRNPVDIAAAILKGGAKIVQMREKHMADGDFLKLLTQVREITWEYGALLIVDDRVDCALASQADGVHLGQEDFPLLEARKLAPELLIGVSTHNGEEIHRAQAEGCSYLNIGPIFPTKTKQLACTFLGIGQLEALSPSVHVPFSVMGGIKFDHLPELRRCGARHVAAVTAFTQAESPSAEVSKWIAALNGTSVE